MRTVGGRTATSAVRDRTGIAARRARRPGAAAGSSGTTLRRRLATRALAVTPTVAGLLALGLVALGGLAWSRPLDVPSTRTVPLRQHLTIGYQARTAPGAAYPTGRLRTPDPVFVRLVPRLRIDLRYRVDRSGGVDGTPGAAGPDLLDPHGTRRVTAELRGANGWHRGFELLAREPFQGDGFDATAVLDLSRVRALASNVEKTTGVHADYTLAVRSEIALSGTVAGGDRGPGPAVRRTFFPELRFAYDGRQLSLPAADLAAARGVGPEAPTVTRTSVSVLDRPSRTDARMDLAGLTVPVRTVRLAAPLAALLLLAALVRAERARRAARRSERERVVHRIVLDDAAAGPRVPAPRQVLTIPR